MISILVFDEFEGVAVRAVVELSRDIESLPVPVFWGRGRMGESTRHPGKERRGRCGGAV